MNVMHGQSAPRHALCCLPHHHHSKPMPAAPREMVALNFTLQPEALAALHDALVCLGKFSESVSIEARRDRVGFMPHFSGRSSAITFSPAFSHSSQLVQIRLRLFRPRRFQVLFILQVYPLYKQC